MMNRKSCGIAALGMALAMGTSFSAAAADSGLYLGASAGQSNFDLGDTSTAGTGLPASVSFKKDESDTAWSILMGYRFNPFIGIEAAYSDFGQGTFTATNSFVYQGINFTNIDGGIAVTGTTLAAVATLPVNNWEFSVKLGAFLAKTEISASVRGQTLTSPVQQRTGTDSVSANSTETLAAIGVGYTFAQHYHLKLEWTRIPKVGEENTTGEGDVTSLALGFHYRF